MAGLPNFATYFGRDMMMAALMMRPIWRPAMSEHVIASVLRKLSPRGDVSHEEALGGQAIRENAAEYNALMAAYFASVARDSVAARRLTGPRPRGPGRSRRHTRELPHAGRRVPAADPRGAVPGRFDGAGSEEADIPLSIRGRWSVAARADAPRDGPGRRGDPRVRAESTTGQSRLASRSGTRPTGARRAGETAMRGTPTAATRWTSTPSGRPGRSRPSRRS